MIADVVSKVARVQDVLASETDIHWSPRELAERSRYRDACRQREWDTGRILAKDLLLDQDGLRPETCEVLSVDANGRHVRPNVFWHGQRHPIPISISHQDGTIAVAIGMNPQLAVGIDVVSKRHLGSGFRESWFSPDEQTWIEQGELCAATAWGIKEAFYKAVSDEEPFAPRQIEILRIAGDATSCRYRGSDFSERCAIDVQQHLDCLVVTIAVQRDVRPIMEQSDYVDAMSFTS